MGFESEIDFDEPIPVFPLGQLVLLPHAAVPLHIFEPRYREMTRDALAGTRLIAMGMLAPTEGGAAGGAADDLVSQPIRPCVCVGRIVEHRELPDGRFNLLLQGRARARIVEEVGGASYRRGLLEPIEVDPAMEIDLMPYRKRMLSLLGDAEVQRLAAASQISQWIDSDLPTDALVDATTLLLCRDGEERYAMLVEPDAHARAERLLSILRRTRDTLAAAEAAAAHARTDEGFFLN